MNGKNENKWLKTAIFFFCLGFSFWSHATGKQETFFEQYAKTRGFRLGKPLKIRFNTEGTQIFFLRATHPRSLVQNLYLYDIATQQEKILLTAQDILKGQKENLSKEAKALRERMRMTSRGISNYSLSPDGKTLLVPLSDRLFLVDWKAQKTSEMKSSLGYPNRPRFSPNNRYISTVRKGNVVVYDRENRKEWLVTHGKKKGIHFGLAEFVAQEEMGRFDGTWWSPNSQMLLIQKTDNTKVETLHIMDPSRPEKTPTSFSYPRAGKTNAEVTLFLQPIHGGKRIHIVWNRQQYPYLGKVTWSKHSPLILTVQNREQTELLLLQVNIQTGKTKTLLRETDPAWINLNRHFPRWIDKGNHFLWLSEKSGFSQIELRSRQGKWIRNITPKNLGLQDFLSVNEIRQTLTVYASVDATQQHIVTLSYNPKVKRSLKRLTQGIGVHYGIFNAKGKHFVLSSSFANQDSQIQVKDLLGKTQGRLRSIAEKSPLVATVQWVVVGKRKLNALILRPQNFQSNKKYPVVLNIYGGPHAQTVRKTRDRYSFLQWVANQGVLVVSIDGRGTPNRGRTWEKAIKHNFVKVPLQDQVDGLKALAKQFPELDITKVGIQGWSFGGYMAAMAVLKHPDIFKVGVAGAPVTDWLDYDTHYTERYLGLPQKNQKAYKDSSVLEFAKYLKQPLLIVHGTADDNVYFSHSLKLANALFFSGKPFDFLPLTQQTHMVRGSKRKELLYKKTIRYLLKHLLK